MYNSQIFGISLISSIKTFKGFRALKRDLRLFDKFRLIKSISHLTNQRNCIIIKYELAKMYMYMNKLFFFKFDCIKIYLIL